MRSIVRAWVPRFRFRFRPPWTAWMRQPLIVQAKPLKPPPTSFLVKSTWSRPWYFQDRPWQLIARHLHQPTTPLLPLSASIQRTILGNPQVNPFRRESVTLYADGPGSAVPFLIHVVLRRPSSLQVEQIQQQPEDGWLKFTMSLPAEDQDCFQWLKDAMQQFQLRPCTDPPSSSDHSVSSEESDWEWVHPYERRIAFVDTIETLMDSCFPAHLVSH